MRTLARLRRGPVLVIALFFLAGALLALEPRLRLRELGSGPIVPVDLFARQVQTIVGGAADYFGDSRALRAENQELRRIVQQLTAENAQVQSLRQQNERLRQLLGFQQSRPELRQLPAEVVYRDPTSLKRYVIVDRGRRDGVEPGMAVVSPGGLVGRVQSVDDRRARVLLLIDPGSAVRVVVQNAAGPRRADGILYGRWPLGRLRLRYVETTAQIDEGAWVLTSGLDDALPPDLPIGIIQHVYKTDVNDSQEADILPAVDPDALDTVAIVLSYR